MGWFLVCGFVGLRWLAVCLGGLWWFVDSIAVG